MRENITPKTETVTVPVPKLAYTMEEAAQALGISYMSVHRLLKRGLLKSSNALRHKIIPAAELERFLKV